MKRTWTLRALGDVRGVMAAAPSLNAAAKALGVDKSTVFRWVKANKVPPPGGRSGRVGSPADPEGWAASIRAKYELDATETELVSLAESALAMARDPALRPADRLAAMARFQALTKQIDWEVGNGEAASLGPRAVPGPANVRRFR